MGRGTTFNFNIIEMSKNLKIVWISLIILLFGAGIGILFAFEDSGKYGILLMALSTIGSWAYSLTDREHKERENG